jgi:hypothetical protein
MFCMYRSEEESDTEVDTDHGAGGPGAANNKTNVKRVRQIDYRSKSATAIMHSVHLARHKNARRRIYSMHSLTRLWHDVRMHLCI